MKIRLLTIVPFLCLLIGTSAAAEITKCTAITSVPYSITKQGPHCLTRNLTYRRRTGAAITVKAANVTLDFNGHKLRTGSDNPATDAVGVRADDNDYAVIRNGTIRGFRTGILVSGGKGQLVEGMIVDQSTTIGISVAGGAAVTLRRNLVLQTGGNTLDQAVYGIHVSGDSHRIVDNDVEDTRKDASEAQSAYGMRVTSDASVIEGNRVTNSRTYGIYSSNNNHVLATNNRVTNESGVPGSIGMRFNGYPGGLYMGNMVAGFTTPYSFGTDGGNNVSIALP